MNVENRTIFEGDNLPVMRGMDDNTVDLIYLDPPFNSNKTYDAPIGSEAAGAAFKDSWTMNDLKAEWHSELAEKHPDLYAAISCAEFTHGKPMKAYLIMMSVRLVEMKRILKPTGSIYLHCDPTASHYLKMMMDTVFGNNNFRNEIVWCYPPAGRAPKYGYHKKHDVILYYSMGNVPVFHHQHTEMTEATLKSFSSVDENGRRYSTAHGGRTYLDESKGRPVPSWWTDIGHGSHLPKKERTGYPTQKPLKLLQRIIKASSNQGDIVLDPFCGCATACVAAEQLDRQWIGIDFSIKAVELVRKRLSEELEGRLFTGTVIHRTDVPVRENLPDEEEEFQLTAYDVFGIHNIIQRQHTQEEQREISRKRREDYKKHKKKLYGQQEGKCNTCESPLLWHAVTIDHILARSKGGTDEIENLQILCFGCNNLKGSRSQEYLLKELERLGIHTKRQRSLFF